MNKFWIILIHTFISKLKTKSFITTTLITLLIIVGLANITNIIDFFDKREEDKKIAVIDETGNLFESLQEQFKAMNLEIKLEEYEDDEKQAEKEVQDEKYHGVLIINSDQNNLPKAVYKSLTVSDTTLSSSLENGLQQMKTQLAAMQLKVVGVGGSRRDLTGQNRHLPTEHADFPEFLLRFGVGTSGS